MARTIRYGWKHPESQEEREMQKAIDRLGRKPGDFGHPDTPKRKKQ